MTEERVIYFLTKRDEIYQSIQQTRRMLIRDMEEINHDSLIREASLHGSSDGRISAKTEVNKDIVFNIVQNYHLEKTRQMKCLQDALNETVKEEESLNKVYRCLYRLHEPYRGVLLRIYVRDEKWENVCKELEISKSKLSSIRNKGIRELLRLYQSYDKDFELEETLLGISNPDRKGDMTAKAIKGNYIEGQLDLEAYMNQEEQKGEKVSDNE